MIMMIDDAADGGDVMLRLRDHADYYYTMIYGDHQEQGC
jgi:hypothetical protein